MIDSIRCRWTLTSVILATIAFLVVACSPTNVFLQTNEPPPEMVGPSKADVVARLGQPDERKTIFKQQEYVWGPPEAWWDTLEMGDSIEIWSYKFPRGTLHLYFLRGSETVDHEAFVDKNIVF